MGGGLPKSKLKLALISSISASLLLTACGSGSTVKNTTKQETANNKAVFTSKSIVSVPENQTKAIKLTASDVDKDALTYFISGTHKDSFILDSKTGVLSFKTPPDYESQKEYKITASVSDGKATTTQDITINITNIDESVPNSAPEFTSAKSVEVLENQTEVITLSASDRDGDALTYSISGTHKDSFKLDLTTNALSFITAPDFESQKEYKITASVSDGKATKTQDIAIKILDKYEWNLASLKTGQTVKYKDGDDGYYQKGVDRSYSRGSDIVTDNITKLQWQDDAEAKTTSKTWSEAKTYCQNLTLGGYSNWRLPSVKELLTIVDNSKYYPAIFDIFENTTSSYYWSSTTYASSTSGAWFVYFNRGYTDYSNKSNSLYVRCVRGGQ